jgi:hypothetical protein
VDENPPRPPLAVVCPLLLGRFVVEVPGKSGGGLTVCSCACAVINFVATAIDAFDQGRGMASTSPGDSHLKGRSNKLDQSESVAIVTEWLG